MSKVIIPKNEIHIELHVPDFDIEEDFYTKLGFKRVWRTDFKDDDGYMVMKRDNTILGFFGGNELVYNHRYFKRFDKNTPCGYQVEIAIFISDMDIHDYYELVMSRIDKKYLVGEFKLHSFHKRDFRLVDPFGFYLRLSEPENNLYEN
jgi:catechol 2,3-dioxygenase-like lactoylglutathione lyase family enzyme